MQALLKALVSHWYVRLLNVLAKVLQFSMNISIDVMWKGTQCSYSVKSLNKTLGFIFEQYFKNAFSNSFLINAFLSSNLVTGI